MHEILPEPGSARRERDGEPAAVTNPLDYPMTAVCAVCEREIRIDRWLTGRWRHADDESADIIRLIACTSS